MPTRMERRAERIRLQRREIARWLAELAVVLLAALLVRAYVFSLTTVQGPSMMDTLQSGQVVAVVLISHQITHISALGQKNLSHILYAFVEGAYQYFKRHAMSRLRVPRR